jgi:hypothetical protein
MKHILLAAATFVLLAGGAYAQTSNSGSNSTTTVNTQSGAQAASISNPHVNVIGNPIGNGASSSVSGSHSNSNSRSNSRSAAVGNVTNVYAGGGGTNGANGTNATDPAGANGANGTNATDPAGANGSNGSGGGDPTIHYSGGYTVRNTPEVVPPSVVGGNPCAVGASGGLSMPGFGIALGGTWADRACERRQQAALMFNMGEQPVAMELMCQDKDVHTAMLAAGKPCSADVAAQTAQAAAAAPKTVIPVATAPVAPPAPKPDWCSREKGRSTSDMTDASKAYVAQMCGT